MRAATPYYDKDRSQTNSSTGSEGARLFGYRTLSITGFFSAALAAAFLLFAISSHWRYSFYIVMRLTVCTTAVYLAYSSVVAGRTLWGLAFGAIAVLFNPVFPTRMHRSDWSTLDMIAAAVFVLWMIAYLQRSRKGRSKVEQ